jgi:peptidoglycan-associated lipoprotein
MNTPTPATLGKIFLAVALCTTIAACKKDVKPTPPADTGPSTGTVTDPGPTTPGAYGPNDLDTDACLRQRVVYFDLDRDALRPEFQAAMACHAKYLRDRPSSRISLEGHADERGSREYNLGLGERRGNSVSSALQASGGSGGQLTVVSYGEERAVCTESGEDCWARNRRVEIVYTAR